MTTSLKEIIMTWLPAAVGASLLISTISNVVETYLFKRAGVPGCLIDIGGFRLHTFVKGKGKPAVVMDSGLGCFWLDWVYVQDILSKVTQTITYDRAGYGFSDRGPLPRDSSQSVDELRRLLKNLAIEPPYILVGHSLGGMNMQLFAQLYSDEVAGLVLVDSSHAEQFAEPPHDQNSLKDKVITARAKRIVSFLGLQRLFKPDEPDVESLPKDYFLARNYLGWQLKYLDTFIHEIKGLNRSAEQVKSTRKKLTIPLVVLKRSLSGKLKFPNEEMKRFYYEDWPKINAYLVQLSQTGNLVEVDKSGHFIHIDQPEAVANEILNLVRIFRERT